MLVWDLILLALALFFVLRGWRRGLAQSVLALVGGIVALGGALVGAAALDEWVARHWLMPLMGDRLAQSALEGAGLGQGSLWQSIAQQADTGYRTLTEHLGERLAAIGVSSPSALAALDNPMEAIGERLALQVAQSLAFALTFAALFVVLLLVLWLLGRAFSLLRYLPVLGTLNRLGGAALGLVTACALAWLLLRGACLLSPQLMQSGGTLSPEQVAGSHLVKYIIRQDTLPAVQ